MKRALFAVLACVLCCSVAGAAVKAAGQARGVITYRFVSR